MNNKDLQSWWDKDEFADLVDRALIISSENYKIDISSWESKLNPSESRIIRGVGPYFSPYVNSKSGDVFTENVRYAKIVNREVSISYGKPIPRGESIISNSYLDEQESKQDELEIQTKLSERIFEGQIKDDILKENKKFPLTVTSNMIMVYIKQCLKFPNKYKPKKGKGTPYIMYSILGRNEGGLYIEKTPFQINHDLGIITPIFNEIYYTNDFDKTLEGLVLFGYTKSLLLALHSIEIYHRDKNLWKVKAIEDGYSSRFGVHEEQVKSLFYSMDTGKTLTGRRKPIIHWIKEHQRRLKDGISVTTIPKSLRGERKLRMGNTTFEIFPVV